MNIPQIWQKLIALVAVVAFTFGWVAPSASAESLRFNAPVGANLSVQYSAPIATGTETGIVSQVKVQPGLPVNYLANNYAKKGAGPEWETTGTTEPVPVGTGTAVEIEGFAKDTPPNVNVPWKKTIAFATYIPDPNPSFGRYRLSFINLAGSSVATATAEGLGLIYIGTGEGITIK